MQRAVPPELASRLRRAAATFAEVGFEDARVEDLSAATGVPSSTIYYYLTGKEGLLAFLLTDWLDAVTAAVEDVEHEHGDEPAPRRLAAIIRAQLRVMREHPATCRVLLAELGRIGRLPRIAEAVNAAFHRPVEKVVRDGMGAGILRAIDPEAVAAAIYGAVTLAGLHYLVTADSVPDDLADHVVGLVLDGLVR